MVRLYSGPNDTFGVMRNITPNSDYCRQSICLADLRCFRHLNQSADFDIIKITVDRYIVWHQWMRANPCNILAYACYLAINREPVNKVTLFGTRAFAGIMPSTLINGGGLQTLLQQPPHNFIGEHLHTAISMVNNKPLFCTELLVRNY